MFGLEFYDQSPQLFPIVGHWGIMVFGLGALMFVAASNKALRRAAATYAVIGKVYIVLMILWSFATGASYSMNYLVPLVADSLMAAGGVWYLVRSRALGQE